MTTRAILLIAILAFNFTGITRADNQVMFPGSTLKTESAVQKSDSVFVCKIEDIKGPVLAALGEGRFYGVKVKVLQVLKGTVDPEVLVAFTMRIGTPHDATPIANENYIFFSKSKNMDSDLQVLKILPATTDSIVMIKNLISN